jgi:KUP system potassium uptake protein
VVFFVVTRTTWKWPLWRAAPLLAFFLAFDIPFFVANITKFFHGGYVPVIIGAAFFAVMVVWRRGRRMLGDALADRTIPVDEFLTTYSTASTSEGKAPRIQCRIGGTGVVMSSHAEGVPAVFVHHVDRLKVLHESIVILTIATARVPYVQAGKRATVEALGGGFHRVVGTYGFMETPDVPTVLREAKSAGLDANIEDVTYFLGRETVLAGPGGQMGEVEETFFGILTRNSRPATSHFKLPPSQVIEIGTQIDL